MYVSQMEGVTDKFRSRIIGVSGVAGAGKDTFFKLLKASLNAREINCVNLSIADSLKNDFKPEKPSPSCPRVPFFAVNVN